MTSKVTPSFKFHYIKLNAYYDLLVKSQYYLCTYDLKSYHFKQYTHTLCRTFWHIRKKQFLYEKEIKTDLQSGFTVHKSSLFSMKLTSFSC